MKISNYSAEKGFSVSLDMNPPTPGESGLDGITFDGSDPSQNGIRVIEFKSATDSNVKFETSFDDLTQTLTVTVGVYYV